MLLCNTVSAQNTPFLHFYSNEDYNAGAVNWKISQSPQGILAFANNNGLLRYDGSSWATYTLPNKTNVRSVACIDEKVYVGGQNEVGYFTKKDGNELSYHSLKNFIPEQYRNFEDVWDMFVDSERLIFRASNRIYILGLHSSEAKVWIKHDYLALEKQKGQLYSQSSDAVISHQDDSWVNENTALPSLLTAVVDYNDEPIFCTKKDGLVRKRNQALPPSFQVVNQLLKENQCFDAVQLPNEDIVFTTAFTGIIICDKNGNVKNVIDKNDGLGNNNIPAAFVDLNKNIWLGLDNGIAFLETNACFNRVFPDGELQGAGQSFVEYKGIKYFGTTNGVYKLNEGSSSKPTFELVENTAGQTWGLDVVADKLIVSHGDGAYVIRNNRAEKIGDDHAGYWKFFASEKYPNNVYAGTYKGIKIFNDALELSDVQIDLPESSRFIEEDSDGHLWMSHPYRGVFRIEGLGPNESPTVIELATDDGIPSTQNNHVFKIKNEILVCAEKGILTYNPTNKMLEPNTQFNELIGADVKTRRLFETPKGDIWYITENEVGLLNIKSGIIKNDVAKKLFPQAIKKSNKGFEKMFFTKNNGAYLTATAGFLHYYPSGTENDMELFDIVLRDVIVNGNKANISVDRENLILTNEHEETLNHKNNNLSFSVSATSFSLTGAVEYQYFLDGFDKNWSNWTDVGKKEYTNLPSGDYTFVVKARNANQQVKEAELARFEIGAPWYKTKAAFALGLFFLLGGLYYFNSRSSKKISAIEEKADNSIQLSRLEVQKLEKEKIQQALAHKNRELISATAHLLKKNETIEKLTTELVGIKKKVKDDDSSQQIERLIRVLKRDSTQTDDWEQFMMHFNELNRDFFIRLKDEYPSLTPKDLKLCAYLKMNLSTKEIATLLNVSVRGVEASRYRLRKKMDLSSDKNITELMLQY